MLRRSDGALRAGTRLGVFLLVFATGAALLAGLFVVAHFPQQKVHGVLQPLPMLGSGAWRTAVPLGLALGMIVPVAVAVMLHATGHAAIEATGLSHSDVLRQTMPMLGASALLSSWEEIVYRGYPFRLLNEMGGVWLGTMVTGVAFGLSHSGNPGANPIGLANTALSGVLLGWIVLRTGSLWLACGYHAGWNIAATELLGMTDSGVRSLGSVLTTTLSGPAWLSGGEYGFEGSVLAGVGETLVLTLVLAVASRRLAKV